MRYYFILISVSDIRMMDNNDIGKEYEKKNPEPSCIDYGKVEGFSHLENSFNSLSKC